ncbi:MAG: hypothetical protein MUO33_11770 [Sedimentisphaerales bacterium]|nr:hypothetical protein [Sedimentisphaerales bacterium]
MDNGFSKKTCSLWLCHELRWPRGLVSATRLGEAPSRSRKCFAGAGSFSRLDLTMSGSVLPVEAGKKIIGLYRETCFGLRIVDAAAVWKLELGLVKSGP